MHPIQRHVTHRFLDSEHCNISQGVGIIIRSPAGGVEGIIRRGELQSFSQSFCLAAKAERGNGVNIPPRKA